jgi:Tol biopolymer transport system component
VSQTIPATGSQDIWLIEWQRNVSTQITFGLAVGGDIAWSPDGLRIASSSLRKGSSDIFEIKASGVGEEIMLVESSEHNWIEDWSKDGQYIVYGSGLGNSVDIYVLPLSGDREPFPIVQSPGQQDEPRFSFSGKWLAYDSNESGTWQTYVISFPGADQKLQVSTNGGGQPRWRQDDKELYYLALDGKMMVVEIKEDTKIEAGIPRVLFDTELYVSPNLDQYAVMPDGQRFLLLKPSTDAATTPITVTINWTSLLEQ